MCSYIYSALITHTLRSRKVYTVNKRVFSSLSEVSEVKKNIYVYGDGLAWTKPFSIVFTIQRVCQKMIYPVLTIALYFSAIILARLVLPHIGGPNTHTLHGSIGCGGSR